ncbi:MAG: DapH/DapD/GlmU-related protein [Chitinophagaceae bacterium]
MIRLLHKTIKAIYKLSGSAYFTEIPASLFYTNWLFQKIRGVNGDVPYSVHYTSLVAGSTNIHFNKNNETIKRSFAVSGGCYFGIAAGSTLHIGDGTLWAWNVNIQTANHDPIDRNQYKVASVVIGKNCWLGGNVTILPGITLGDNVTVGANSVVTKSFPSNVIIAGVPAKVIRSLDEKP